MSKVLLVSSAIQAELMKQLYLREIKEGFWSAQRPVGHSSVWDGVEIKVSETDELGCVGFETRRGYNFLCLDLVIPNGDFESKLVQVAQSVKSTSNLRSVKKELVELGQIVGGRLTSKSGKAVRLYRGNHRPGTETVLSVRLLKQGNAPTVTPGEVIKEIKVTATRAKKRKVGTTELGDSKVTVATANVSQQLFANASIFATGAALAE